MDKRTVARFFSKVAVREGKASCWEWQGAKNNKGYGQLRVKGLCQLAHRLSFEFYHGAIPTGALVLHACDNPACVNPDHLSTGSHQQNTDDALRKGRLATGEKVKPQRGTRHKLSKLTDNQVKAIRADKRSDKKVAAAYGVAPSLIFRIRKRQVWRHV